MDLQPLSHMPKNSKHLKGDEGYLRLMRRVFSTGDFGCRKSVKNSPVLEKGGNDGEMNLGWPKFFF